MDTPLDNTPASPPTEKAVKAPLLPPILCGASAYLWLWLLPIGLLLLLNLQGYWLIEGNMEDDQRGLALWLGIHNVLNLALGTTLMCLARTKWRDALPDPAWALFAVGAQIGFLWHATAIAHDLLPGSVTLWIYPESRFFYNHYAFCMLPLFWGIIRIACGNARFLSKSIWKNLAAAVLAPVVLFIGFQILKAFDGWWRFDSSIGIVLIICCVVALSVIMFIALIRGLMLIFKNLSQWGTTQQSIAIGLIALLMPIGGLLLNRSIPFPVNFQAWEVYALVVANTAFLLWAVFQAKLRPRLSFWLLCASFPFTLYFFVVFLPYTPLSILGVIAMGTGFLVLTPTFLFTLHLYLLLHARRLAARKSHNLSILTGGVIAFLLLPGFFTMRGYLDKSALNLALDYMYTPNYETKSITYPENRAHLRRALASHRNYKNGIFYPLLSDYYSWLVFDNLVLPDDKIAKLENVFFGSEGSTENLDPFAQSLGFWGTRNVRDRYSMPNARPPSREVDVVGQDLQLSPVDEQSTRATLTLTLKNVSENAWGGAEYINKLSVPPGVLIDGFRLHIDGTPVPGRISEKKTALWVYTMIRDTERRDPGLLVYNHPQEIELRVFPINTGQPATVEIDFLIPEDTESIAAPKTLPDPAALIPMLYPTQAQMTRGDDFTYMAPVETNELPKVKRENYLHLIIDRSQENGFDGTLAEAKELAKKQFPKVEEIKVSLANYNVIPLEVSKPITELPIAGGLDLDKALAHSIVQYTKEQLDTASDEIPAEPVFIVISRTGLSELPELEKTRIWQSNLSQLCIHSLSLGGEHEELTEPTNANVPIIRIGQAIRPAHPRRSLIFPPSAATPAYAESSNGQEWLPLKHDDHPVDSAWAQAIGLWVSNHRYAASPGSAATNLKELVAQSRKSGVLIPATSYIVVENEAQWRMLEKKEGQKLEQNEALDFLETPAPGAVVVALGFGAWLLWRNKRQLAFK